MIPPIIKFMRDPAGNHNANGDYSDAPVHFTYKAAVDGTEINRMIVTIRHYGISRSDLYGGMSYLQNGITVWVDNHQLTEEPIRTSADWTFYCFDPPGLPAVWPDGYRGPGSKPLVNHVVRWSFSKSGAPIKLDNNDQLIVRLNDDLSGLHQHFFNVQGFVNGDD